MSPASFLSRRTMLLTLAGGTGATISVTAPPSRDALSGPMAKLFKETRRAVSGIPLAEADFQDWAMHTGSLFTAETGHFLKLTSVACFPARERPAGLRSRAFAAQFEVVVGDVLAGDRTYRFNHATAGLLDIFLLGDNPANPKRMLAVFN